MGSTATHRPQGTSTKQFLAELFTDSKYRPLDVAIVGRTEAYVAAQDTTTGHVQAFVVLLGHMPKSHYNIWYKEMTEAMGPNASACPERILDLLSPVEDVFGDPTVENSSAAYAAEWRRDCRARLARRKALRGSCKAGQTVTFAHPLRYSDGSEYRELVWTGKGSVFTTPDGIRVRVPNWRDRATLPA